MKYAVFSVSMPELAPQEAVRVLKEIGYDGVEWRVVDQTDATPPGFWSGNRCTWPLSSFIKDAPQIRQLVDEAGLGMPAIGAYATSEDLPKIEIAMRGAAAMGVDKIRVNVPWYDGKSSYKKAVDAAQGQFKDVASLSRKHGVKAMIEIHFGNLTPSASAAAAFLSPFDPTEIGAIHDAGNMVKEGFEQYRLGFEMLGPYLAHVHLKNAAWNKIGKRDDGSDKWDGQWAPIPEGSVDFDALFTALKAIGYDGWLSFEDFSTTRPLRERLERNLAYIKQVHASVAVR